MLLGIEVRQKGTAEPGTVIGEIDDLRRAARTMIAYLDLGLEARIVQLPKKRHGKRDMTLCLDVSGWGWKRE